MANWSSLALPIGPLKDGRPIGVQNFCPPGSDLYVVEAAAALETLLGSNPFKAESFDPEGMIDEASGPRDTAQAAQHHHN